MMSDSCSNMHIRQTYLVAGVALLSRVGEEHVDHLAGEEVGHAGQHGHQLVQIGVRPRCAKLHRNWVRVSPGV